METQQQKAFRTRFADLVRVLQQNICTALENVDGKAKFITDEWTREGGGGGITRVISGGNVFEKGGVNTSEVYGKVTPQIEAQLGVKGENWFATGISLVIHPYSPMVPTTHANYRYFEVTDNGGNVVDAWFGGGADLTPYYLFEEDAKYFHVLHKASCDKFDASFYPTFKKWCDDYFNNTHRGNERRGIGGIFYDHQKASEKHSEQNWFAFAKSNGQAFIDAYIPIVEKRKNTAFSEQQKHWQLIRRGRYVEFNLIHDRGTIFGLKSNGRTESILMSLPAEVRWEYDFQPAKGSEEEKLMSVLLQPIEWI